MSMGVGMRIGDGKPAPPFEQKKKKGRGTTNPERADIRMGIGMGDCKPAQYCEGKKKEQERGPLTKSARTSACPPP